MSWYRTGTATFTNGSAVVTGSGTDFVANALAGYGLVAPDGRTYEIASIQGATQLTLATVYQGSTGAGAAYAIFPTHSATLSLVGEVRGLITDYAGVRDGVGQGLFPAGSAATPAIRFAADQDTGIYRAGADNIGFATAGTYRLYVYNDGIVISGAMSVSADASVGGKYRLQRQTSGANLVVMNYWNGVGSPLGGAKGDLLAIGNQGGDGLVFASSDAEAARFDAGGRFMVGTPNAGAGIGFSPRFTVDGGLGDAVVFHSGGGANNSPLWLFNSGEVGNNLFAAFIVPGGTKGSITYNRGAGLTAYNTTSDYRAKDILGPFEGSGEQIDELQIHLGRMKGATLDRPMLVAHEVQEVCPYAVTGEKDAEDAKGEPLFQQVDHSVLVPLLIAEVQALRARVASAEDQILVLQATA